MDQFFVKKGILKGTNTTEVKVHYKKSQDLGNETLLKKKRELEQKEREKHLPETTTYDFRDTIEDDESKLEEMLKPRKKLKVEDKGSDIPMSYEESETIQELKSRNQIGYNMLKAMNGGKFTVRMGKNEDGRLNPIQGIKVAALGSKKSKTMNRLNKQDKTGILESDQPQKRQELTLREMEVLRAVKSWKKKSYSNSDESYDRSIPKDKKKEFEISRGEDSTQIIDMRGSYPKMLNSLHQSRYNSSSQSDLSQSNQQSQKATSRNIHHPKNLLIALKSHRFTLVQKQKDEQAKQKGLNIELEEATKELKEIERSMKLVVDKKNEIQKFRDLLKNLKTLKSTNLKTHSELNHQEKFDILIQLLDLSSEDFQKYGLNNLLIKETLSILQSMTYSTKDPQAILGPEIPKIVDNYSSLISLYHEATTIIESAADIKNRDETIIKDINYVLSRAWSPPLQNYVLNEWDHEDPEELIEAMEKYKDFLPEEVFYRYFDSVVVNSLNTNLSAWNIDKDYLFPHLWIHPWLTFTVSKGKIITNSGSGSQFIELISRTLKRKFRQILQEWSPEKAYALEMMKPWKSIMSKMDWEDIVFRDILPKVIYLMEKFNPDPSGKIYLTQLYFNSSSS